jgi:hypothetical protein
MLSNNGFIFYHKKCIKMKKKIGHKCTLIYPPFCHSRKKWLHKSCIFRQKIQHKWFSWIIIIFEILKWKKPFWIQPAILNFLTLGNFFFLCFLNFFVIVFLWEFEVVLMRFSFPVTKWCFVIVSPSGN